MGVTEAEENQIAVIQELLETEFFKSLKKREALVPDFNPEPTDGEKANSSLSTQITIGNVYGQLVMGDNHGNMLQSDLGKELADLLVDLFSKVTQSHELTSEIKGSALGDIQTIQAQLMKPEPDKGIVKKAAEGLGILADATQVAGFSATAAPYDSEAYRTDKSADIGRLHTVSHAVCWLLRQSGVTFCNKTAEHHT